MIRIWLSVVVEAGDNLFFFLEKKLFLFSILPIFHKSRDVKLNPPINHKYLGQIMPTVGFFEKKKRRERRWAGMRRKESWRGGSGGAKEGLTSPYWMVETSHNTQARNRAKFKLAFPLNYTWIMVCTAFGISRDCLSWLGQLDYLSNLGLHFSKLLLATKVCTSGPDESI